MPALLLLLFSGALFIGAGIVVFVLRHDRGNNSEDAHSPAFKVTVKPQQIFLRRPSAWLAIRSRSLRAVQSALGLHNPKPCSCMKGMNGEEKLFIAPPVKGWVLVVGAGLPDPDDDVDACFRFLQRISRKLGQVQFFSACPILHHHAWVRAERGRIVRAYAWAGRTLWQQGQRTAAENELGLKCLEYTEEAESFAYGEPVTVAANVDKVPLLAARWSLDPGCIDERFLESERGVAGEFMGRY